jgi:hypothetical protein
MFIVDQCGAVVVTMEELLFDWHVFSSTHALCSSVFYLLINSKFEFLAKKWQRSESNPRPSCKGRLHLPVKPTKRLCFNSNVQI